MKRLLPFLLTLPLAAAEIDPKVDRAVRDSLPVCGEATVSYENSPIALPPRFSGRLVRIESSDHRCDGQLVAVTAPSGAFFLGVPWNIEKEEGATIEAKLKNFAWRNLQETVTVSIDRKLNEFGLFSATLLQTTEYGQLPMEGEIDREGKVFFFGHFRKLAEDSGAARTRMFQPFLANAPSKGPAGAPITIVEFSDFQCPSCRRSAGYADQILSTHGDKVRYVRFDLPLSGHAWAFPAALAGRAIHRQKPDLFWEFKKQVYENQDELNAFAVWDWARGFASDHELDLKQYDADLISEELRAEILRGAGTAFSNDIRSTPSYLVNGRLVDAGTDGKALLAYVEALAK